MPLNTVLRHIFWITVNILYIWLAFTDSNYKQWRVIHSVFMETLHTLAYKLSIICVAAWAAGLTDCLPHWGSVRAVCNEPCYWSWSCGTNFSCGCVLCERQSSGCSDSLGEDVCRCEQHAKNWLWVCDIPWTPLNNSTHDCNRSFLNAWSNVSYLCVI